MVFDLFVLLIIAFFVISGYKKGVIYSVLGMFGSLVSAALSSFVASFLASTVYQTLFMDKIQDTVAASLETLTGASGASEKAQCLFNSLPDVMINAFELMEINNNSLAEQISSTGLSVPELIESMIRPTVINLITIALSALLFMIFVTVLKIVANILTKTIDFANLSMANKMGGAILGMAEAVIIIMIFGMVMHFTMMFFSPDNYAAVQAMIDSSYLYGGIYKLSIPDAIISAMSAI